MTLAVIKRTSLPPAVKPKPKGWDSPKNLPYLPKAEIASITKEDVFRCSPLSPALIFYTNELKLLFTSIKRNIYLKQLERECAENQKFSAWRPLYGSGSSGTHFPGFTALCAAFHLQEQQR